MRTLFLCLDSVMRSLGSRFTAAQATHWLFLLAAELAVHADVQLVLHRKSEHAYPPRDGEVLMSALGRRIVAMVGPSEVEGTLETYLRKRPQVTDFALLENDLTELSGSLRDHLIVCDPGLEHYDPGFLELLDWLCGQPRARGSLAPADSSVAPVAVGEVQSATLPRTERVVAVVAALVHEFELVRLEAPGDLTVSIGKRTPGVDYRALRVGQKVECVVEGEHATRVVWARLLPPDEPAADAPGPDGTN